MAGHNVEYGKHRVRRSYSRINEVLELPNLIEIQTESYRWLLDKGIREMFSDISPIEDHGGKLALEFVDYSFQEPKYDMSESRQQDTNYAAPMYVKLRLINSETGEIKEQEVFFGDFPLMTDSGTFIINGSERVIVSQLVRSPGVYYNDKVDKNGKLSYGATVIPNRGAWLEMETDAKDISYVRIDRTRKLQMTVLMRALGFGSDDQIRELFGDSETLSLTLEKDVHKNPSDSRTEEALKDIYERLRPGEPKTAESSRNLLNTRFFDPRRYDLAAVGRYKINKKLDLKSRLYKQTLAENLVDNETGEIVLEAGTVFTREVLDDISDKLDNGLGLVTVYPNDDAVLTDPVDIQLIKIVAPKDPERVIHVIGNAMQNSDYKSLTVADVLTAMNYFLNLYEGLGTTDDIDHLGNRRIRSVGELLQNQLRIGLSRMERVVRERMSIQDIDTVTPPTID